MTTIREPAVADFFYSGTPQELAGAVRHYLDAVDAPKGPIPKALIVPHAGYIYSGQVAASAYARLAPVRSVIRRVVLMGPSHHVPLSGLAFSEANVFRTPLGDVPVEKPPPDVLALPGVVVSERAHVHEHSLEVHLPFLQEALDRFSLIPIVAGDAQTETIAAVLDALWDGAETLVVVSSDLSHYLDYESAQVIDRATCDAIEQLDENAINDGDACGCVPVRGLLRVAKRRGLQVETLDLRNSGDTAGPHDQVVGYGAWMFV